MPIYKTTGQLTGHIAAENVSKAQAYLTQDDMTQYIDDRLKGAVERVQWRLDGNGHDYEVEVFALRELTEDETGKLSEWISGQNSDGLGEGFEQQPWAWVGGHDREDYYHSMGGYDEEEDEGHMASFDWQDNDSVLTRVS